MVIPCTVGTAYSVSALCLGSVTSHLVFDPDVTTQQVERHDVARTRNADAVERDQRHRQSLDGSHARVIEEKKGQPCADGHDKIGEPEDVKDQVSIATFRQQRDAKGQKSRNEITPPGVLDKDTRKKVVRPVPEEK
jgi:hypothetical protein